MKIVLSKILAQIHHQEDGLSFQMMPTADEAYQMTLFLNDMQCTIKAKVLKDGFTNEQEEIDFFKNIKPQILGKLIYYNKVFRIETNCPVSNGKIHQSYYENLLKNLKSEYKESICNEDFYRYYRADRTDRDHTYFRLGKVNYHDGLKSGVFEIDLSFSTYYDNKIAYIIANELLYTYMLTKINPKENPDTILQNLDAKQGHWTEKILLTIKDNPNLHAIGIAKLTGFEKEWLKLNIRKLKNLGLTISHNVGYELSPLGNEYLNKFFAKNLTT